LYSFTNRLRDRNGYTADVVRNSVPEYTTAWRATCKFPARHRRPDPFVSNAPVGVGYPSFQVDSAQAGMERARFGLALKFIV
jgi:hypothetical protein